MSNPQDKLNKEVLCKEAWDGLNPCVESQNSGTFIS